MCMYLFSVLLGYMWLLGTFVNSSCDIKINITIYQNCCTHLAVRRLTLTFIFLQVVRYKMLKIDKFQ